ncbi:MAG TPA: hypothetical protein VM328_02315 [Fimbriimonadaceae bacterium]|nr:hypothetical protein [Fimbriimonadaceae bacterium]
MRRLLLAKLLLAALVCAGAQEPDPEARSTQQPIDETLRVEGARVRASLDPRVLIYEEGVKAYYDVTTVEADRLTLYLDPEQRRGVAEGNVVLRDPAGMAFADRLEFSWRDKTATGENLRVESGGAILTAERANIVPGRWELLNVTATTCGRERPFYSVRSPRIVIVPGQRGVARNPSLYILGNRIITLPQANFSLDRRVVGVRLPGISFKRGSGLGITWSSGVMLDDHTSVTAGLSSYPNRLPGYGAEVARSAIPPTAETGPITPQSELAERFSYGYFEHIGVRTPGHEHNFVSQSRDTMSVGSFWNLNVESRRGTQTMSKPIELAYERSLPLGAVSSIHQVRVHNIKEHRGPSRTRLMTQHLAGPGPVPLAKGLDAHLRLNASAFLNGDSLYGWGRLQVGAVYQPLPQLRLGAAYMFAGDMGDALYASDRLYSTRAWHLRGDLDLGPTRLSVLGKYDVGERRWYDHEYSLSQVIGCFEGYVLWRQFPSDYRFGLRLRADLFFEALQNRSFNRTTRQKARAPGNVGSGNLPPP